MSPHIRVNVLARELEVKVSVVLETLRQMGVTRKLTNSSSIDAELAEELRKKLAPRPIAGVVTQATRQDVTASGHLKESHIEDVSESKASEGLSSLTDGTVPLWSKGALDQVSVGTQEVLILPPSFTFNRKGFVDFDHMLRHLNWTLRNTAVMIDLTTCTSANFQAMALLIQYAWWLSMNGCTVTFKYGTAAAGPTKMLNRMGASRWREILRDSV